MKWIKAYKLEEHDFSGATFKDLSHYIDRTLEVHSFEAAIIHIGVNHIISSRNSPDFDRVWKMLKILFKRVEVATKRIFLFLECYQQHV